MHLKKYKAIIVGGSAAGITAAITARRHYPDSSILLLRKEKDIPIPCGIPYIFGLLGESGKNLIPVEQVMDKNGIDTMVAEVNNIDREAKKLSTVTGESFEYEKLVIATGSNPIVPPISGSNLENVYSVHKVIPYLDKMLEKLNSAKNLCIVGGGFIGVEFAEECRRNRPDLKIYLVEMMDHCLRLVYDEEFCIKAEEILEKQNISLLLNEKVEAFNGDKTVKECVLASGKKLEVDMVLLGIGAFANVELAKNAGLELGPQGAVKVNRYMQSSDKNIFACGDCAEKVSFFDGTPSSLKLASIATMEARIAGANLFATTRANLGVMGVFSTVLGDSAFASAGLTTKQAIDKGFDVITGEAESVNRHPGAMPGSVNMKVKLIFEAANQVLIGGQIFGAKSSGELINAVSACINRRMTADDIATFQTGTHPALTASPIAYQLVNAAEVAVKNFKTRMWKKEFCVK